MKNETNENIQQQIKNKDSENEIQNYEYIYENNIDNSNQSENTENQEQNNQIVEENTVLENTSVDIQNEKLEQIHQDLGIICSFLIIFALVIVFRYIYRFFDIFFKI